MTLALPAALIAALTLSPMQDGRILRTVGGFDVVQFSESCEISTPYEFAGRSDVTLFLVRNERGYSFGMTSWDWSNQEGDDYTLQFRFDDLWFEADAVGIRNSNGKGIQIDISGDALTSFREARSVLVASGETVITNLSLSGSSAAVAALDQCWAPVNRRMAAERREIDRFAYIPKDPFSAASEDGSADVAPGRVRPPVITNPSWTRQPDPTFPDRARERGLTGSASLSCTVYPNGSVSGCSVVSETPAGAGFGRAALAAASAARLSPRSVDSVAAGGTVRFDVPFLLEPEPTALFAQVYPNWVVDCASIAPTPSRIEMEISLGPDGSVVAGPIFRGASEAEVSAPASALITAIQQTAPFDVPDGFPGGDFRPSFQIDRACRP